MLGLRGADHVEHERGSEALDAVDHTGKVARGVVEPTVALADNERQGLALAVDEAGREHHVGPVGLLQQPGPVESLDHLVEQAVVARLAREVRAREQHTELAVDDVEVGGARVHQLLPEAEGLDVAGLEGDDTQPAALLEIVVAVELDARLAIEAVEVADGELVSRFGLTEVQ